MLLAYEGTRYQGFGLQPGLLTIQGVLEQALAGALGHPVRVTPAGRTDAGVHAVGQVVSFETGSPVPARAMPALLNARLPYDVVAGRAHDAPSGFDARRSARRRVYRYSLWTDEYETLLSRRFAHHCPRPLDLEAMNEAAARLCGTHDFSSFIGGAAEEPFPRSPVRRVERARWRREGRWLHFDCTANAFGRHMVRGIVGTLIWVGRGRLTPDGFEELLRARDRRAAGPNAPARGLTLRRVDYPRQESL